MPEASQPQADEGLARQRAVWAAGDLERITRETIGTFGSELVDECGVRAGQRVLDVAAGTGNATLPALRTGAEVVALDITPEVLEIGRKLAAAGGLAGQWIEGDAERLPFPADDFDVVLSSVGAMFAPGQQRVADEMVRVCRPGGTIGLINWTSDGWVGDLFRTVARHVPPPPGVPPAVLWGSEPHVRQLFGDRVTELRMQRRVQRIGPFTSPAAAADYYAANLGPLVMARRALAADPAALAALDRDLLAFMRASGGSGEDRTYEAGYLLVRCRTA